MASFLVLASSSGWGDTIVLGSGSLANVPTSISNPSVGVTGCGITVQCGYLGTGPYWDNLSGDGTAPNNQMNVGYILTGTCSVTADCPTDYDPLQYLSQNNGAGNPNSPSSISLLNTSSSPEVTLLEVLTGDGNDTFGYYNASDTTIGTAAASETPILGPLIPFDPGAYSTTSLGIPNGEDYGFYLTRACYTSCPAGNTSGYITLFSNPSLNTCTTNDPSCSTDQFFTIFTSPTSGVYFVGIEDRGLSGGPANGEGNGDYNDIVFELNTNAPAVPEPASFSLMGVGLFGLGLARFRARKNRT